MSSTASPGSVMLYAGELSARLDGWGLRDVRLGNVVLAERIYLAVRDEHWNTVAPVARHVEISGDAQRFEARLIGSHRAPGIGFEWEWSAGGTAGGELRFSLEGHFTEASRTAKVGLNLHHDLTQSRGRPYRRRSPLESSSGVLPTSVSAGIMLRELFAPYDELDVEHANGLLEYRFTGDLFAMQDHRNWTDANFKSYGTPLSVPYPVDSLPGDRVAQSIVISFKPAASAVDAVAADAASPEVPGGARLPIIRVGHTGLIGRTFAELNTDREPLATGEPIRFPMAPSFHAPDDETLMRNARLQCEVVTTAREVFGERDVVVSPITLIPRGGPYSAGVPGPGVDGDADARQDSVFAAAWTVASVASLTAGGASVATYFETDGPRGIRDGDALFPVFHVLRFLQGGGHPVFALRCALDDAFVVLGFETDKQRRMLVANLTSVRALATVDLGVAARVVHMQGSTPEAGIDEDFAVRDGETLSATVELAPYGVAFVRAAL